MTVDDRNSMLLELSDAIVAIYKERFGRGPRSARSYWTTPDVLTVVLEETLTPAERTLAQMGEHWRLRETRMFFQYASTSTFCEAVERIAGRKVRAFMSSIDTKVEGLSVETFMLHPAGHDGPSRSELGEG